MPKPLSQAWCDCCLRRDFIQAKLALANASPSSSAPKPKIIGVPPSQGRGGEPNATHPVLHFRVPAPALTQEQWQPHWPPCALPSIATDFDVLQDVVATTSHAAAPSPPLPPRQLCRCRARPLRMYSVTTQILLSARISAAHCSMRCQSPACAP
ncbi:hypothetical protein B0H14DRAFT_1577980 [Mycena olivaceomarginata]|nr:hypothetical protein B0H14DRAFT_1577980 [Mycena olivaceomarginata]